MSDGTARAHAGFTDRTAGRTLDRRAADRRTLDRCTLDRCTLDPSPGDPSRVTDRRLPSALVLAAGLGTRMRPLTATIAKPLLALEGRTLLDRALDRLAGAGIGRVAVNAHWQADAVAAHLAGRTGGPETVLLREDSLRGAAGTIADALRHGVLPSDRPVLVVNGDSVWFDGPAQAVLRLADGFDPARADAMLLLVRTAAIRSVVGRGDFMLDPMGGLRRPAATEVAPFLFGGVQILSPALFAGAAEPPAMNLLWDRLIAAGRLQGLVHDGDWLHLSTPTDLAEAEEFLADRVAGNGI